MDWACFREWARLKAGKSPELIEDGMVTATARVHGLGLATRNERDFGELQVGVFIRLGLESRTRSRTSKSPPCRKERDKDGATRQAGLPVIWCCPFGNRLEPLISRSTENRDQTVALFC